MDSATRRRLVVGFITTVISKLASSVIQFAQVPILLHYWGKELSAEWFVLSGIPAYLSFTNIGLGNVAGNEMTMLAAAEDREGALRVFQSCWWLIAGMFAVLIAVVAAGTVWLPTARLLHLTTLTDSEAGQAVFWLSLSLLLGQLELLLQAAYRSVARYAYGNFLKSGLSLVCFGLTMVPVVLGHGIVTAAKVFAVSNISATLILCVSVRRNIPWIRYGWKHASWTEIRRLLRPSIAFMGYPLGNAFNLQGSLMAVNYALGPEATLVFSTARTVSRIALQIVEMVKNTFWPELSIAFGAGNMDLVRRLHRRACQLAIIISICVVLIVKVFGNSFLRRWTLGKVQGHTHLVDILLIVVVFYALWSTSSVLVSAINKHERLAMIYAIATGVTVVVTYFATRAYGLYGAALSLLLSEFIMDVYVLPASLKICGDTWPAFLRSMVTVPANLRLKRAWKSQGV